MAARSPSTFRCRQLVLVPSALTGVSIKYQTRYQVSSTIVCAPAVGSNDWCWVMDQEYCIGAPLLRFDLVSVLADNH